MNKIACMIVTYNRCKLLRRCLDALDRQTCQNFDIVVLNNGSTDETAFFVEERKETSSKNLILVNVEKNVGMAYGYNRGYSAVFERGYDWIWTMDDDGMPEEHQLQYLINAHKETGLLYLNAIVCDIDNKERLSFDRNHTVKEIQSKPYVYGNVYPDNGTFINKEVYFKSGNIMSELYSYGMENEYVCRVKKNGFKVATVTNAIQYHPAKNNMKKRIFPHRSVMFLDPDALDLDRYCIYVRNYAYIHMKYYDKKYLVDDFLINIIGLIKLGRFHILIYYLRSFTKGICGRLTKTEAI